MRPRFKILAIVVLIHGFVSASFGADPAATPVDKKDKFWKDRHAEILDLGKKGDGDIIFLGDSITQEWDTSGKFVWKERWEPLKAVNFGISGDRTQHVLWRVTEGKELAGLKPKLVVLLIGTNNLGSDRAGAVGPEGNSAEEIADGVATILAAVAKQSPQTPVLLLGILPRGAEAGAPVRSRIKDVNGRLAKLADGQKVRFADVGSKFVDDKGNLQADLLPDALHLSPKGYQVLAEALRGEIERR